ncbi:MAG: amidohydrolase family protein [Lachnospiraceae bacterium]|nr:amidohydrolase family protein [Lachnospiraceae bacterium]
MPMNEHENFILQGDVAFNVDKDTLQTFRRSYVVCEDGKCSGVFPVLPEKYKDLPIIDHGSQLIIPGMTDLHMHAAQYPLRGIGMDKEQLDWLKSYTFEEEARYEDLELAKKAYESFAYNLRRSYTTRAVIYGTIHNDATIILMDELESTGLETYVGRINMDRNSVEALQEENAEVSLEGTKAWLSAIEGKYENTRAIITPRFIPACSDELMKGLGELARERGMRMQSQLSENLDEIRWVKQLVPDSTCYGNAYELFGTLGDESRPSVMAHCIYSSDEELEILKKHGAYIAHCADSNINMASGIAPIHKYMDLDLKIGLGTDVAAGTAVNMTQSILRTLQASKMYYRLVDDSVKPLTIENVFYLATMGGGEYFGKVGSFLPGYDFDAVVVDDSTIFSMRNLSVRERIERMCYNDTECVITGKFVKGKRIRR